MSLIDFSEELRKQREEKNTSLITISKQTRIQLRYLEAIEQGNFDILPQTYIRAFLKAYAEAMDISVEEVLHNYDVATGKMTTEKMTTEKIVKKEATVTIVEKHDTSSEKSSKNVLAISSIVVIVIIGATYLVWNNINKPKPQEIPFQEVLEEHQQNTPAKKTVDTIQSPSVTSPINIISDSLILKGKSTDSVWLSIIIDSLPAKEFFLVPQKTKEWKAKKQFILTIGNAGGINFSLNEKVLGTLGKRGAVVRNISITEKNLAQ